LRGARRDGEVVEPVAVEVAGGQGVTEPSASLKSAGDTVRSREVNACGIRLLR